jgi:hypothetical protein
MIKVNFKDGTTLAFDLSKEDDVQQWTEWSEVQDFQSKITGIGILHAKRFYTIPFPKHFKRVRFYAELVKAKKKGSIELIPVAEKLSVHADEIVTTLMIYTCTPSPPVLCRVDMQKIGKQMFPVSKPGIAGVA